MFDSILYYNAITTIRQFSTSSGIEIITGISKMMLYDSILKWITSQNKAEMKSTKKEKESTQNKNLNKYNFALKYSLIH